MFCIQFVLGFLWLWWRVGGFFRRWKRGRSSEVKKQLYEVQESKLSSHAPYPIREFMAYGVWGLFSCGEMSYYEVT